MTVPEYCLIKKEYGDARAKRSGQLLIKHIDEGLRILRALGASRAIQGGWCLHPLLQSDEALQRNFVDVGVDASGLSIIYAMEYRAVANSYLNRDPVDTPIRLGVIPGVRLMLIADKVQNCKDYLMYQQFEKRMLDYFRRWFAALDLTWADYVRLAAVADG